MRRWILNPILAFLFFLAAVSAGAQTIQAPTGFAGKVWHSTFALYGVRGLEAPHFLCTTEAVQKTDSGYLLLSAGHCVVFNPADVHYSVAEEIGGPLTPVTVLRAVVRGSLDFSLFDLTTVKKYPVMEIDAAAEVRIGDKTINPNFALGLGKQLSRGVISSATLTESRRCPDESCWGLFIVQESAGPGASGSAVLSEKTHKMIGVVVQQPQDSAIGFLIEPINRLATFMTLKPQISRFESEDDEPIGLHIPEDDFKAKFGADHTFMLTVHGPNPQFTQAGYTFATQADGFELSDDYYYNVPVFIEEEEDGTYRLTSTKEGAGVEVLVVKLPEQK